MTVTDSDVRRRLRLLVAAHQQRKPPTCAQLVRDHLTLEIGPVRSLLSALMILPWEATPGHPVLVAVQTLEALYAHGARKLPTTTSIDFGKVWRALLSCADRKQAFRAFEVATLLALRNGTVWIDHSLAFRSRERLFIPAETWQKELLVVYAGVLAHGTSMSAAETARMMLQLSAASVRQAMRWAGNERRLAEASAAVLGYLRRHPISTT